MDKMTVVSKILNFLKTHFFLVPKIYQILVNLQETIIEEQKTGRERCQIHMQRLAKLENEFHEFVKHQGQK